MILKRSLASRRLSGAVPPCGGRATCRYTVWPMVDLASVVTTLLTPVYGALLSFGAGYLLHWLQTRETEAYERQTKRLQFWRTFYEVKLSVPVHAESEADARAQQTILRAQRWAESLPTNAHIVARYVSAVVSLIVWFVAFAFFHRALIVPALAKEPGTPAQQLVFVLMVQAVLTYLVYKIIYKGLAISSLWTYFGWQMLSLALRI